VTYVLGEEVLSDHAHTMHHAFLATLPTRDVAAEEYASSDGEMP
jgi:hypothetical protein